MRKGRGRGRFEKSEMRRKESSINVGQESNLRRRGKGQKGDPKDTRELRQENEKMDVCLD